MQPAGQCGGKSGRLENGDAHLVRGVGRSSVGGAFERRHSAGAGCRCNGGAAGRTTSGTGKSTSNGPGDSGKPAGNATGAAGEPADDGRDAACEPAGCGDRSDFASNARSAAVLNEGGK